MTLDSWISLALRTISFLCFLLMPSARFCMGPFQTVTPVWLRKKTVLRRDKDAKSDAQV
jgi:hypothetical protein